jgi:transposase
MDSPSDIETLRAAVAAERARAAHVEIELALARAKAADDAATIARQNLEIAKLKRQIYGPRSEHTARLLDQMELGLEELEAAATEDEIAAELAATKTTSVSPFTRKRPSRQPFPEHLPRERVVIPAPTKCECCGSARLRKLGETFSETLEVIPRQWKVIQYVREKMTCRDCERISEPPAPFHVTPRGWAGPNLLAMLLFEKFGQKLPTRRRPSGVHSEARRRAAGSRHPQCDRKNRATGPAPGSGVGIARREPLDYYFNMTSVVITNAVLPSGVE